MEQSKINLIIIAALGLVGVLASTPLLRSARPPQAPQHELVSEHRTPATSWEDPLVAISKHQARVRDDPAAERLIATSLRTVSNKVRDTPRMHAAADDQQQAARTLLLIGLLDTYPDPFSASTRHEYRVAVRAALTRTDYKLVPRDNERYITYWDTSVLRIPPLVPYKPDSAVVNSTGYDALRDCATLPYSVFIRQGSQEEADAAQTDCGDSEHKKPFGNAERVVLIWLWHDRVRPHRLHHTVALLTEQLPVSETKVIGPPSSEALQVLVDDLERGVLSREAKPITYVSPYSTVDPSVIFENWAPTEASFPVWRPTPRASVAVQRVISSDNHLVGRLWDELRIRYVTSRPTTYVTITPNGSKYADEMLKEAARSSPARSRLVKYSYFSNLENDAQIESDDQQNDPESERGKQGLFERLRGGYDLPPQGRSQLDAVERMVREMERDHAQSLHASDQPTRSVFVSGGDVFDKLTILRALHGTLGGALRLTTDLYALYLHEDHQDATRGLIAASAFGLELGPCLQGSTPPFRTSYQTATYFAALGALDRSVLESAEREYPPAESRCRVYEIGRDGAYDLSAGDNGEPCDLLYPSPPRSRPRWTADRAGWGFVGLMVACVGLAAASCTMKRHRRLGSDETLHTGKHSEFGAKLWCFGIFGALLAVGYMVALTISRRATEEPIEFFSGTSAWPGILIRGGIAVIGVVMMLMMLKRFRNSDQEVNRLWGGLQSPGGLSAHTDPFINTVRDVLAVYARPTEGEPRRVMHASLILLSGSIGIGLLGVALSLLALSLTGKWPAYAQVLLLFALCWAYLVLGWLGVGAVSRYVLVTLRPNNLADAQNPAIRDRAWWLTGTSGYRLEAPESFRAFFKPIDESPLDGAGLLRWYREQSRPSRRVIRASVLFAVFSLFITAMLAVLPPISHTVRGGISNYLFLMTWMLASVIVHIFNFLVLDACRLCREAIIRLPSRVGPMLLDPGGGEQAYTKRCVLELDITAEMTRTVLEVTLYPAILITGLIISISSAFEVWSWTPTSVIAFSLSGGVVVVSAFLLRNSAGDLKARLLSQVETLESDERESGMPNEESLTRWRELRERIEGYREGAFGPLSETPALRAALIPFSGLGTFEIARIVIGV